MATAGLQKTATEIIPVVADFTSALASGDSVIGGNVTVTVANVLTDADVTATALVTASIVVTGAIISCKIQAGTTGNLWVVRVKTGLTTLGYKFELEQNVEITSTPLAANPLCDFDDLKTELQIDPGDTSDDVQLFTLILEASDYFRYRCQRDFVFQKYTETIRPSFQEDGVEYSELLRLRNWPVYGVDGITLRQINSGDVPFDTVKSSGTWGWRRDGYVWLLDDVWMMWPNENIVSYRAGYPIIPKDLQRAVKSIAVWFYRLAGREGLASEKIGSYAYTRARLTDFPSAVRFELPDEYIEGVISRYTRRDIGDQE